MSDVTSYDKVIYFWYFKLKHITCLIKSMDPLLKLHFYISSSDIAHFHWHIFICQISQDSLDFTRLSECKKDKLEVELQRTRSQI